MNPKLPYAIGLALEKEFKSPVAVGRADGFVSWLWDDYRVTMAKDTDYAPKAMLSMVKEGLKSLRKTYPPPGAKHERNTR
jgi:hypothetical protein